MQNRVDSSIVEYHEDGTQTITTVEHYIPPTKAQKATGLLALTGLMMLPAAPILFLYAEEKMEARRSARKEAKLNKAT